MVIDVFAVAVEEDVLADADTGDADDLEDDFDCDVDSAAVDGVAVAAAGFFVVVVVSTLLHDSSVFFE